MSETTGRYATADAAERMLRRHPGPDQIRRNDPARRRLHDYWLVDGRTGKDLAGFATQAAALAYLTRHRVAGGQVTVLSVVHPDSCDCLDAPARTSTGRPRR